MHSVRGQTSLERSAFSMPPHMNESFSKGTTFARRYMAIYSLYMNQFIRRNKQEREGLAAKLDPLEGGGEVRFGVNLLANKLNFS